MWPFSVFRKKDSPDSKAIGIEDFAAVLSHGRDTKDYLGPAAQCGSDAQRAVREKRYSDAWGLLHLQKQHYMKHAASYGMTPRQAIALVASVHEALANIRRLEGDHTDALVHITYCVASSTRPTKAQEKKILAYFRRCGYSAISEVDFLTFLARAETSPDFVSIRNQLWEWKK